MRFQDQIRMPAPREVVWDLLADTERLNREMGLPPIHFDFLPREGGGSEIVASIRLGRLSLRYREHPFEWVRPESYSMRRTFFGGPLQEIRGWVRLEADGQQTEVTCTVEILPRNAAGTALAPLIGRKSLGDFMTACRSFASYLAGKADTPYPRHSPRSPAARDRLERARARLAAAPDADARVADRLAEFLERAPAEDVIRIRPFELADRWGDDRLTVLRTCLVAARVGMLDLRWRVLCPSCRGTRDSAAHLREVAAAVHCDACNIRFDADFDRSVEVSFAAPPAIRRVRETTYCVGGPALTPHVVAQWLLAPDEERETTISIPPGTYRLTGPRLPEPLPLRVEGDGDVGVEITPDLGVQAFGRSGVQEGTGVQAFGRSGVRRGQAGLDEPSLPDLNARTPERLNAHLVLCLRNRSAETVLLRLETIEWSSTVATAALVTSLQAFRDQFSSEVLAPGTELAVRQVCVLFTDLKGSTAMYRQLGDAPSYRAVRDHFDFLRRHVSEHGGAIVKTIGDAVMATFYDPADGLAAALAIQREAPHALDNLTVKLGMHWGPAIAVNANDILDYFGHTVNLASRLQGESVGGDIVLSEDAASDSRLERLLAEGHVRFERFEATVRGLDEPMPMLRVWPVADESEDRCEPERGTPR